MQNLPVDSVTIGDLEDLQDLLCAIPADLLVANSHAADLAEQFAITLVRAGFPLYDRLGEFRRVREGYAGMRDTLFELANTLRERHHHRPLTTPRCASTLANRRFPEATMHYVNRQFSTICVVWSMKVAFASSDYHHVDQHFGATPRLVIYGVKENDVTLLRVVDFRCSPGTSKRKSPAGLQHWRIA